MMHLICPACLTVNRVPQQRLDAGPKCGKCSAPLLDGEVIALDSARFAKFVKSHDLPLLVDFWAAWCGPCRVLAPVLAQLARELPAQLRIVKIDTEAEQQLAQQFAIRSIPTLVLFKRGVEAARISGALDAAGLERWLASYA